MAGHPFPPLESFGRRVCIIGISNGGKSSLGEALSRKIGVPCTHLDLLAHAPHTNWQRRPDEEFAALHAEAVRPDGWVIEGCYSLLIPPRFARATGLIWLDFGRLGSLCRFFRRSCLSRGPRHGMLEGAPDAFNFNLARWIWAYPERKHRYIAFLKEYAHLPQLRLTSFSALQALYKAWDLPRVYEKKA